MWLLNIPLGYYCLYLDYICIHGSALLIKNKVSLFLGFSGIGKSTILSMMIDKHNIMVTEDVCLIDSGTNQPKVIPSFPIIKNDNEKYFYEIGHKIDINIDDKRNRSFFHVNDNFFANPEWHEIKNIYVLKSDNINSLNRLSGIEKFEKVLPHLFKIPYEKNKKIFINERIERKLFSKLSGLLNNTNIFEIKRNANRDESLAFINKILRKKIN